MDKEQKKLLLVAISVGVFLLVSITAAMVVITPKVQTEETAFSSSSSMYPGREQPLTEISAAQPQSQPQPVPAIDPIPADKNNENGVTIIVPQPVTAAVPDVRDTVPAPITVVSVSKPAAANTSGPAASANTKEKPAAQTKPAANTAVNTAAKPASSKPATTSKPAAPAKTSYDFWVQTGAFKAKIRAEDTKELLASKGLTSIIENRSINGQTWYRVRIGPYTSEKEANYWLSLVKSIEGFDQSQVRQTAR